ncbi:MAG TPA: tetratricopeptide repeat protein, partial [Fimbriiglobus sp.]|nr:tetratricopeptide repeat protein [Fimbriiglobus sp.]
GPFARACGMASPLVIVITHRATGLTQSSAIDRPFVFLGRAKAMGVRLDDPSVSQCHAYVQIVRGVPYCIDLGSRTGVVWDDGGQGRGWVYPGQTLRVGEFDVRVGEPGAPTGAAFAPGAADDPTPVLEVHAPAGGSVVRHPLDHPVTLVGRHPNCDLRLLDDGVPYFQCALVVTPDGVWCVDIWSLKGTRLNGRSVRLARVHDGDLIELGRTSVVLQTAPGVTPPPAVNEAAVAPAVEALSALPRQVAESVSGVFASFREVMEQSLTTTTQALTTIQQEQAAAMAEQVRQVQELTRELQELRAAVERESAAARALAVTQQEHAATMAEQMRQVQELARELRVDAPREEATQLIETAPPAVEPSPPPAEAEPVIPLAAAEPEPEPAPPTLAETPPPVSPPPPPPAAVRVRQAQTVADTRAWSLDRPAMTVPPPVGNSARVAPARRPEAAVRAELEAEFLARETAARKAQAERIAGQSAEWRQAEVEMGNEILASVLTERRAKLGPDHPDTVATLHDLALGYRDAGQRDKALPMLEEALRHRRAKLGPDHIDTLTTMHMLASVSRAAGLRDQSLTLYEEALQRATTALGPEHSHTLATTGNLASTYLDAKQTDQALALFERFIPGMRKQLGADTLRFAGLLALVAMDLLTARQFAVAETYLRECLDVLERKQPEAFLKHQSKSMLGGSLLGQGKYDEAEPLLLAGYQGMKRMEKLVPQQGQTHLRETADRLAELYTATGKPDEAAIWQAGATAATEQQASPA